MRIVILVVRIMILTVASFLASALVINEVWIGYPHPLWWLPVPVVLFAAGLVQGRPLTQHKKTAVALASITLFFIVVHSVPWPTRDPFFADLHAIRPGMTALEVNRIMARDQRGTGWPANPLDPSRAGTEFVIKGALVFRPASAGPGDSNWGIVHFAHGRVTSVEFSPD